MRDAWRQFQGDGGSTGFKWRPTAQALRPDWRFEAGVIIGSSPVVDDAGVVYLLGLRGELIAVEPDGSERLRRHYDHLTVAAPAVADDGTIHFIGCQRRDDEDEADDHFPLRSVVVKTSATGHHLWSFALPDEGFATNAVKLWQRTEGAHVVVSFIRRGVGGPAGELLVLGPDGEVRARSGELQCPWPVSASGPLNGFFRRIKRGAQIIWEGIKEFPFYEFDTSGRPIFPYMIEPTPTVTDAPNLTAEGSALIAMAYNLCNLTVFRYDGARLQRLWRAPHALGLAHGSPLVTGFGHLVIGDDDGTVRAFEVETGRLAWSHDAGEPVLGTAASLNQPIYVPTRQHLHVLDANRGRSIARVRLREHRDIELHPRTAPAVSLRHVHIAAPRGLTSVTVGDWSRRAHDTAYSIDSLSHAPAIGPNGERYAVHAAGELWAYPAP